MEEGKGRLKTDIYFYGVVLGFTFFLLLGEVLFCFQSCKNVLSIAIGVDFTSNFLVYIKYKI